MIAGRGTRSRLTSSSCSFWFHLGSLGLLLALGRLLEALQLDHIVYCGRIVGPLGQLLATLVTAPKKCQFLG